MPWSKPSAGASTSAAVAGPDSLILIAPLGLDATTASIGLDARRVVAIDTLFPYAARACKRRTLMFTPATLPEVRRKAHGLFAADGARVSLLQRQRGLHRAARGRDDRLHRSEIAQQRVASPADIDTAVRLGLGYPMGPLAMGDHLGPRRVVEMLEGMLAVTGDPRYRPGLWLQPARAAGTVAAARRRRRRRVRPGTHRAAGLAAARVRDIPIILTQI